MIQNIDAAAIIPLAYDVDLRLIAPRKTMKENWLGDAV